MRKLEFLWPRLWTTSEHMMSVTGEQIIPLERSKLISSPNWTGTVPHPNAHRERRQGFSAAHKLSRATYGGNWNAEISVTAEFNESLFAKYVIFEEDVSLR